MASKCTYVKHSAVTVHFERPSYAFIQTVLWPLDASVAVVSFCSVLFCSFATLIPKRFYEIRFEFGKAELFSDIPIRCSLLIGRFLPLQPNAGLFAQGHKQGIDDKPMGVGWGRGSGGEQQMKFIVAHRWHEMVPEQWTVMH